MIPHMSGPGMKLQTARKATHYRIICTIECPLILMVLVQAISLVGDMYDLYKDYGGKIDMKDGLQLDDLNEAASGLRTALLEMNNWIVDQHNEMVGVACNVPFLNTTVNKKPPHKN